MTDPTNGTPGDAGSRVPWVACGVSAYVIWGFLPLLFTAIKIDVLHVVANRILWSAAICLFALVISGRLKSLLQMARPERMRTVAACALLLFVNWGVHVFGILNGQVIDAGLGYLMNPLLSVLAGVMFLGERLSAGQWLGVGLAATGCVAAGVQQAGFPWVMVLLPVSWTLYGLVKKKWASDADTMTHFGAEMMVLAPVAVALSLAAGGGPLLIDQSDPTTTGQLVASGAATVVPLLLFNASVRRVSLSALGMTQYVSALIQIALGVAYYREPLSIPRLGTVLLVVAAVVVFALGGRGSSRRNSERLESRWPQSPAGVRSMALRRESSSWTRASRVL